MAPQQKTLDDVKNKKLLQSKGLINGEWVDSVSGKSKFDVVDPATLDKLTTLPEMVRLDGTKGSDWTILLTTRDRTRKTSRKPSTPRTKPSRHTSRRPRDSERACCGNGAISATRTPMTWR